jgi:hypothetical protein
MERIRTEGGRTVSKPPEWWDAELERIILEHYRKSYREWWARQCIEYHAHPVHGADFCADVAPCRNL